MGEIIFQAGFHLAETQEAAIEATRRWKPTQMDDVFLRDIHDPGEMQRLAADQVSDEEFANEGFLVGADAGEHVERLRGFADAGATVTCLQLIGSEGAIGSIERYGREVLPEFASG